MFLIRENIKDCGNLLEKFTLKDGTLGIKATRYICIGSEDYNEYTSYREEEEKLNEKIIKNNRDEIIKLASESEDNINFSNIRRKIIDDFNIRKLFIYMYTDIGRIYYDKCYNNSKAYEIVEYNSVKELDYFIFDINNELFELGKTIRLYMSNSKHFTENTGNLKPIILGQKEISMELQKEYKNFNLSIGLNDLIEKLIKSMDVENSLQRHYGIDNYNLFKYHRNECYSRDI